MFVCFYYSVSILFLFIAMRLNAYKLICLYYNSKHPCKLSCLCLVKPLSFRLLSLLCLFCLCSALLFVFVCYAIKCAPCSGNAGRQKQHHGQSIAERRQGERLRRAYLACFLHLLSVHNATLCAGFACRGAIPPPAGGTFSVRFDGGKQPNPSCSSPKPIVLIR